MWKQVRQATCQGLLQELANIVGLFNSLLVVSINKSIPLNEWVIQVTNYFFIEILKILVVFGIASVPSRRTE